MNVPYLDVRAAHIELRDELQLAYARVMDSGRYILGAELEAFEREFAGFCETRNAVGVGNGLDALTIALRANDIGPGDEVIVPAHTFFATWLAVVQCGARLVPVDVEPESMLIDPDAALAACTPRTAAIVPVHLYGHPVDPVPFERIARSHGLLVVGDAAQAHGAKAAGRSVGAMGNAAIFSFYPSKNLGAAGDGGAITTDDDALAERARRLRNYGSLTKYEFSELGINSRLDPLQAALLRTKLRVLSDWNARRARIAARYIQELAGVSDLALPSPLPPGAAHAWHTFCVRHPRRDELRAHLDARGIQTQVHYPVPPHRTAAFAYLGLEPGSFPVAEATSRTVLSLPIGPHLDDDSITSVIDAVRAFAADHTSRQ
jgi:dTDP-3-amino-3,4,6-trideoxy-alpha-D-glucose transaminase